MNEKEAYDWLAPKLHTSERKVLDIIIEQLQQQNENLKCCGNCDFYDGRCELIKKNKSVNSCCEHWQTDGFSQEERK